MLPRPHRAVLEIQVWVLSACLEKLLWGQKQILPLLSVPESFLEMGSQHSRDMSTQLPCWEAVLTHLNSPAGSKASKSPWLETPWKVLVLALDLTGNQLCGSLESLPLRTLGKQL